MDIMGIGNNFNQANFQLKQDQAKDSTFENVLQNASNSGNKSALKDACVQMESYFLWSMFKEMRNTIHNDGSEMPASQGEKIFTEMLDQENAKKMANAGGIGLAKMLYREMKKDPKNGN